MLEIMNHETASGGLRRREIAVSFKHGAREESRLELGHDSALLTRRAT